MDYALALSSNAGTHLLDYQEAEGCEMKVDTYKYDVCGKVKGDVNHWWLVWMTPFFFAVRPWADDQVEHASVHLCGAECVNKKVNEFLSKPVSA